MPEDRKGFVPQHLYVHPYLTTCFFCAGTGRVPPINPEADCTSCQTSGYLWETK